MGVRKNAKFLSSAEREDFVKACILMKADIVNPGAVVNSQYSVWDEYVAVHNMIQTAFAPGSANNINFGHGGTGSYSFLSWHRYFLYQFEKNLQSYVPGVMLPYWDWQDPSIIMTNTFLGPNGSVAQGNVIRQGYFAFDKPGSGANATPLPAWWPANLVGWRLPTMFPAAFAGGLKRQTGVVASLPSVNDVREGLARPTYPAFQVAMESGAGLSSGNQMHNGMHNWIGGPGGHMTSPAVSPFDPFFYLHHCNIDRLWAMWQMDGHQTEYPTAGGTAYHHRNDIMYPWTGGAAGYGTNAAINSAIPMPNYAVLGAIRNVDTLDFRNNYDYTYDTIAIMGIGLDRTGSMNGLTPDPMDTSLPDVTKWEAAKRGVSAFLQDCETVQDSGAIYVMAGIKTFTNIGTNRFTPIFVAPNYGLIKTGTAFSRSAFDANISAITPLGATPLADALMDVQHTLVEPPFNGDPSDEQRYMAFMTDGMLNSGSPMGSIPNGSLSRTAIFAMGFGTGADVDYATIASLVAKGKSLATPQVFHGENAGTIDKFYSNALAAAIGFDTVFDPVIELFAGEHTHLDFMATSAEDSFFITAQGMDFTDKNWSFTLHGPQGQVVYGSEGGHKHGEHCNHCCPTPDITSRRSNGRLTLVIQRGNTGKDCWVGKWQLMISYKAKELDKMMMLELGELLFPVSAGPIRGPRYSRLLVEQGQRIVTRNILTKSAHNLDSTSVSTNSNTNDACNIWVNIYSRGNLKLNLGIKSPIVKLGEEIKVNLEATANVGSIKINTGLARLIVPAFDIEEVLPKEKANEMISRAETGRKYSPKFDVALALGKFERRKKDVRFVKDLAVDIVSHENGLLHAHHRDTKVPGLHHFGVYVEGVYFPNVDSTSLDGHDHHIHPGSDSKNRAGDGEAFVRLLNINAAVTK